MHVLMHKCHIITILLGLSTEPELIPNMQQLLCLPLNFCELEFPSIQASQISLLSAMNWWEWLKIGRKWDWL